MTIVACPAASLGSAALMSDEEEKTEHQQKMEDAKESVQKVLKALEEL